MHKHLLHHSLQNFPRCHLSRSSPNHQLHQYKHLQQHPQISSNHPLNYPTTISTTTTSIFKPVIFPKQPPSKKELHKKICLHRHTKGMPNNIRPFLFQRHSTQTPQEVHPPIQTKNLQPPNHPPPSPTPPQQKPHSRQEYHFSPAQNPPLKTPPLSLTNTVFQKNVSLPSPPLSPHQPKYLLSLASTPASYLDFACHPRIHLQ